MFKHQRYRVLMGITSTIFCLTLYGLSRYFETLTASLIIGIGAGFTIGIIVTTDFYKAYLIEANELKLLEEVNQMLQSRWSFLTATMLLGLLLGYILFLL